MKLYLMRHGDYAMDMTQQKDVLTEKGIQEIEQLTSALVQAQVSVSQILHSGKFRAQQTAEIIAKGNLSSEAPKAYAGLQPNDEARLFADQVQHWRDDCFVVGHLPFMGRLVNELLVGEEMGDLVDFEVGTVVCLEKIDDFRWIIQWVLKPSLYP